MGYPPSPNPAVTRLPPFRRNQAIRVGAPLSEELAWDDLSNQSVVFQSVLHTEFSLKPHCLLTGLSRFVELQLC